jgi:GNAT superfamily N-acetyltransferase
MVIRSFCLADCARVPALFEATLTEECFEETMSAFASQLAWDSDLILVAADDDEVVAVIIGTIEKDHGLYHRVVVAPNYRSQGIGKQLIQKLQERFIQRHVKSISVRDDSYNKPLISVWEKMNRSFGEELNHAYDLKLVSRA